MKRFVKLTAQVLLIMSLVFSAAACNSSSEPKATTTKSPDTTSGTAATTVATTAANTTPDGEKISSKDTAILAIDREPASLDPGDVSVTVKKMIDSNIYDTLFRFDNQMNPTPCLAEKIEQVDDTTWKVYLRKGIKFHNGEEMKASDVIFSFKRLYDMPAAQSTVEVFDKDGFSAPDDYTVIFKTDGFYAFVLPTLCSPFLSIVNEKAVKEMGDEAHARNPIGTGPFKFVEWTPGDSIVLERNDDYWRTPAILKTIKIRIITESASRTIDLESGGIDVTFALPNSDAERIKDNPETQLISFSTMNVRYIGLNCQNEKLTDVRVRQALHYATDREAIRKVVYGEDTSAPAICPVPPGMPGRNEDLVQYDLDIEKAKALLAEAGKSEGLEIEFMYLANAENNMLVEMLQQMWAKIGVKLILKPTESAALSTALNKGEHQVCVAGSNLALGDSGEGLFKFFHSSNMFMSGNRTNLSDSEVDRLLDELLKTPDEAARNKLAYDVQVRVHELSPMIYICHPLALIGARADVRGIDKTPSQYTDLRTLCFVE